MITVHWNDYTFELIHYGKGVFHADMAGHSHAATSYELHFIIGGKGMLTTETDTYLLSAGDFFVTGPNAYHRQSTDKNHPLEEIYLYLQGSTQKTNHSLVSTFLSRSFYFGRHAGLAPLFERIVAEQAEKKLGYESIISGTIQILLTEITRFYLPEFALQPAPADTLNDRRFLIIEEAFINHPELTLSALADAIGLCERQTQRLLKKYYRQTFSEKKRESNGVKDT